MANLDDLTEIWDCDPLVITDADGAILFAGRAQAEFTPDAIDPLLGRIVGPELSVEGKAPMLEIVGRLIESPAIWMGAIPGNRPGRTLWGRDAAGQERSWYIGADGVDLLMNQGREAEFPIEQP